MSATSLADFCVTKISIIYLMTTEAWKKILRFKILIQQVTVLNIKAVGQTTNPAATVLPTGSKSATTKKASHCRVLDNVWIQQRFLCLYHAASHPFSSPLRTLPSLPGSARLLEPAMGGSHPGNPLILFQTNDVLHGGRGSVVLLQSLNITGLIVSGLGH